MAATINDHQNKIAIIIARMIKIEIEYEAMHLKNTKLMIRKFTIKHDYLKIIPRVHVGYELVVTYLE